MTRWTRDDIDILCRDYPDTTTADLARRLGRTERAVYQAARSRGVKKSAAYMQALSDERLRRLVEGGKDTRIGKGATPWNKGRRWCAGGRSAETRFKPGNRPQTWVPVGTERVTKDGILERKVSDTRVKSVDWRPVHVLLWEEHNGPVPDGHFVVFENRDRTDIRIDNLVLVDRAENMRRNTVHRYPEPLVRAMLMRGALNRHIRERRERHVQKQDRGPEGPPVCDPGGPAR